jgi:hypothetical protein
MGYAILRTQKLKSSVAVRRSMKHAFREQDTPNADPSQLLENTHIGAHSVDEGMAAFNAALPDKYRKNAVLAIEYLITASPEAMNGKTREQQDRYFTESLDWLRGKFGDDQVIYAGIHRDEKTPHMYAYVVPRDPDTGRLNCRRWLGGAKALSEMQTDFADRVGRKHGLERGIEGSKAKHQRVSQHYAAINRPEHQQGNFSGEHLKPKIIKKKLFSADIVETYDAVAKRLKDAVHRHYEPTILAAATTRQERRRADEMAQTARAKERELKATQERLKTMEKHLGPILELAKLEKSEFVELVLQAQERVKVLKHVPEKTEPQIKNTHKVIHVHVDTQSKPKRFKP